MTGLQITVNDYAGHPFQIQLARALADLGHRVTFLYCSTNVTPHGNLVADRPGLEVIGISTGAGFDKYRVGRRALHELRYGLACARIQRRRPADVVVASNVPVLSLLAIQSLWRPARVVLWLQDIQSGLVDLVLGRAGRLVARLVERLERRALGAADAVIAIAPSMVTHLQGLGVETDRLVVIENWAPLDDLPQRPRTNAWSTRHGLDDKFVFLHAGSLGAKHRPDLLVELCETFATDHDVRVVAVSEGRGADQLARDLIERDLDNLVLLPFQAFDDLPDVLASADVLVALLDERAGSCSIPSKVLSYLCAGRPILASLPPGNSAAELLASTSRAGLVSQERDDFIRDARRFHRSEDLRLRLGDNGRAHAEKAFDIDEIAQRFVEILTGEEACE